ncbi:MAG: quinolinate synthase NadA [Candidatus Omnitrophica bacterium]|nr:quinolinate synthase NadA [Candidatus Omnitrophota bacterium]
MREQSRNEKIKEKLGRLKKERQAVILAHNYQLPEVQEVADFCGDSLELSRIAARTQARIIVFCGVHFMAQTASILSPEKRVLMPDINSGCPMAEMLSAGQLRRLKNKYPEAVVVAYVNTTAEVKAEADICCTSSNAVEVVSSLRNKEEVIFVPDKYLADFVSQKTKRKLIIWEGFCPAHIKILAEDLEREKRLHPNAAVVLHPECMPEAIALSDAVHSTSNMCRYVKTNSAREFIVGTEVGIIYRLKRDNPDKEFYPAAPGAICPDMKRITVEKILHSLEELKFEIKVPARIRNQAKKAIDRMLTI